MSDDAAPAEAHRLTVLDGDDAALIERDAEPSIATSRAVLSEATALVVVDTRPVEGAGDPDLLAGDARAHAAAPVQPLDAGTEAQGFPGFLAVEPFQQDEETVLAGVEVGGEFGDLVGEPGGGLLALDALRMGGELGGVGHGEFRSKNTIYIYSIQGEKSMNIIYITVR